MFLTLGPKDALKGLTDPQMWNSYAYARNNPYKMVDPDGQSFLSVVSAIGNSRTVTALSNASNITLNFMSFGAGDAARQMADTGVTIGGVMDVYQRVQLGTAMTALAAVDVGAAAGHWR